MNDKELPKKVQLKLDLMFDGIRYSDALAEAAEDAFPNFYPYRFAENEIDPTGKGKAKIPYLMSIENGISTRIKGNGQSNWFVEGGKNKGYILKKDTDKQILEPLSFAPMPAWMQSVTNDGTPMSQTGISLHGDMAVINIAPACQYFLAEKENGVSMRCSFCAYGAPDQRSQQLGQVMEQTSLTEQAYARMKETLVEVIASQQVRHIYLVGGSMVDWEQEGQRFIELAREVQSINQHKIPVSCGSGAIPDHTIEQLYTEKLVDSVCFNLEVWSEPLFSTVCPGKHKFVGYDRWIAALEKAVSVFGKGRVYTAMVAGIELEEEYGLNPEQAIKIALQGAEDLCSKGIIPIYSLYWPVAGRNLPERFSILRQYFEQLNIGYAAIRKKYDVTIWDGFMCSCCAYMQLECDVDKFK